MSLLLKKQMEKEEQEKLAEEAEEKRGTEKTAERLPAGRAENNL